MVPPEASSWKEAPRGVWLAVHAAAGGVAGSGDAVSVSPSSREIEYEDFRPDKIDLRSRERKRKKRPFADVDSRQRGFGDFLIVLIDDAHIREPEFEPPIIGKPENGVANAKAVALKLRVQPFLDRRRQKSERYGTSQEARIKRTDREERGEGQADRSAAAKPE